jgi:transcription termination/antitermination protein NusA
MMFQELEKIIEMFGKDKGIERELVIEALETAMENAAKKKLGPHVDLEAKYNAETGEIEVFQFKTIVEDGDVADEDIEIELAQAKKDDPDVELGDSLGIKLDAAIFGRIAAQNAKQVINQKIRDAEKELIYSEFLKRKGEIISGIVRRFERGNVVVDLGKTEAYMPIKEQIPGEQYRIGDRVQAFLLDVLQTPRGPRIILSRATPLYLVKLFEMEVPEIYEGIVTIKSAARNPGSRAKIAVTSKDPDVDPVGACVGMRGSRVQNIVSELKGERIDIIPFKEDIARFACSALAPAEVSKVLMDEENKFMEVVIPDSQLSLAIGRGGQNVRLASQLTGWKIDVMGETQVAKKLEDAKFSLTQIPEVNETNALFLYQNGFKTVFDVAESPVDDILDVPGYEDEEKAKKLVERAKELIDSGKLIVRDESEEENKGEKIETQGFTSADDILKNEMKLLIEKEKNDLGSDELLKVKGVGPSLLEKFKEQDIDSLEKLVKLSEEEVLEKISWDKKEDLSKVYKNAVLLNKEKLIVDGKEELIKELETIKSLESVTDSVVLRISAAGFKTIEDIKNVSLEDFILKTDMEEEKAKKVYEDIKSL